MYLLSSYCPLSHYNTHYQPFEALYRTAKFYPCPNLKKKKTFADDKSNATLYIKSIFGRVENNMGKGENTGYQYFRLLPQCF